MKLWCHLLGIFCVILLMYALGFGSILVMMLGFHPGTEPTVLSKPEIFVSYMGGTFLTKFYLLPAYLLIHLFPPSNDNLNSHHHVYGEFILCGLVWGILFYALYLLIRAGFAKRRRATDAETANCRR